MTTPLMKKDMKDVISCLQEDTYLKGTKIAKILSIPQSRIYRIVRELRMKYIGILSTPKGYVLASRAAKRDDVHLMRRFIGMHNSMHIIYSAAEKHIKRRWARVEYKDNLLIAMKPMVVSKKEISRNFAVLTRTSKGLDI